MITAEFQTIDVLTLIAAVVLLFLAVLLVQPKKLSIDSASFAPNHWPSTSRSGPKSLSA